jgi:hypothetical protein
MAKVTIRGELKKAGKGFLDEFVDQLFGIKPAKKKGSSGSASRSNHYHIQVHNHFSHSKYDPNKKKR